MISSDHCFQLREEETTKALITTPSAPVLGKGPPLIDKGCRCLSVSYSDSVVTHFLLGKKRLTLLLWPSGICRGIFEVAAFPSPVHRSPLGGVDITTTPTTVSAAAALVFFFLRPPSPAHGKGKGKGPRGRGFLTPMQRWCIV